MNTTETEIETIDPDPSTLKHFVVEQISRYHIYAPDEDAVQAALEAGAFDVDETEDHEQVTVLKDESVSPDKLARADDEGIPVVHQVDGVLYVDGTFTAYVVRDSGGAEVEVQTKHDREAGTGVTQAELRDNVNVVADYPAFPVFTDDRR